MWVSVVLSFACLDTSLSTPHLPQGHCFLLPALLFPPPLVALQQGSYWYVLSLLEKAKLAREISDGKNEIPHKFLGRKI